MRKWKAFTLVELLVVIAIIALLMSILMPALSRARAQTKAVMCQGNLKQLGLCFLMYADDNDQYFMKGWREIGTVAKDYWMELLRPCYKDGDVRCCPMATKPGPDLGGGTFYAWGVFPEGWWTPAVAGDYGSYGNNSYICNPPADVEVIQGHETSNNWRTANVRGVFKIPLILDEAWIDGWPHHTDSPPEYEGAPWNDYEHMIRFVINRHDGSINGAFLDNSVRRIGLKELWKLKWHRTFEISFPPPVWPEWMKNFSDFE